MASRKHHKQDATRPTKARERRIREHALSLPDEEEFEERGATGAPAVSSPGGTP